MIKSGQLAKMYDKWFVQPIPPANTKVGLPLSDGHQGGVGQSEYEADGRVRAAVMRFAVTRSAMLREARRRSIRVALFRDRDPTNKRR